MFCQSVLNSFRFQMEGGKISLFCNGVRLIGAQLISESNFETTSATFTFFHNYGHEILF